MAISKQVKTLVAGFLQGLQNASNEMLAIDTEIARLQHRRNVLVANMEGAAKAIEQITQRPTAELVKEIILSTPNAFLRSNMTIGDAIATIISNEGPQFQKDIIEKIINAGIKVSKKSPYNVIGNAIRADKQKRFMMLTDGRVALKEETEKADAKG